MRILLLTVLITLTACAGNNVIHDPNASEAYATLIYEPPVVGAKYTAYEADLVRCNRIARGEHGDALFAWWPFDISPSENRPEAVARCMGANHDVIGVDRIGSYRVVEPR